jgi:hypothetical protein
VRSTESAVTLAFAAAALLSAYGIAALTDLSAWASVATIVVGVVLPQLVDGYLGRAERAPSGVRGGGASPAGSPAGRGPAGGRSYGPSYRPTGDRPGGRRSMVEDGGGPSQSPARYSAGRSTSSGAGIQK